jgi:hypothetical protein
MIDEIGEATDYQWELIPAEAGTAVSNLNSCEVTWSSDYTGTAILKACGINNCGEGGWSPELEITVENCTGIALYNDPAINIYPNPNTGSFLVETVFSVEMPFKVSVIDLHGTIIYERTERNDSFTVELQLDKAGVYYLKLEHPHQTFVKKIIISQ